MVTIKHKKSALVHSKYDKNPDYVAPNKVNKFLTYMQAKKTKAEQ